jgi:hypothetical protein
MHLKDCVITIFKYFSLDQDFELSGIYWLILSIVAWIAHRARPDFIIILIFEIFLLPHLNKDYVRKHCVCINVQYIRPVSLSLDQKDV